MIEDANCPIKIDCPFYDKVVYDKQELNFYMDYCLKGGIGCGLKAHYNGRKKSLEEGLE